MFRVEVTWDDEDEKFEEKLEHFLKSDLAPTADRLVIGAWDTEELYDTHPGEVIELLVKHKDRLPKLKALFLGDIIQEQAEMSWIQQTDISPLLRALGDLELLRVRGSDGLAIDEPAHPKLRALGLEAAGLEVEVVRSVCTADFPKLEYLELWLGSNNRGSSTVEDLMPILSGKVFPGLKHLGLRNCDHVDAIAGVIVNAPIVQSLESLDLSFGTLSDEGGQALLNLPTGGSLKRLNLHHHFMGKDVVKRLKALELNVDVTGVQEDDEDWRFTAVDE